MGNPSTKQQIVDLVNYWEREIKEGRRNKNDLGKWIDGLLRKFPSREFEVREVIKGNSYIVDLLGGSVPSYNRRPPRRMSCCGG
jgi:hypothetical protein